MKLVSWNVNGIRACIQKGFLDYVEASAADIFCIQESKMQEGQIELELPGYHIYYNSAVKKGYSGVMVFSKEEPLSVVKGLGIEEHDQEGRVLTMEYPNFYLVNVYTPNAKEALARLDYRQVWDQVFLAHLQQLETSKPVIVCGDLNVAHQEIDLKNPKANVKNPGYSPEERAGFSRFLEAGFIDTFRFLHPELVKYSWWSYRFQSRAKNIGWRIDYFLTSKSLQEKIRLADIDSEQLGSDHAPVILEIEVS
ncbi:MAG: exodeoxyribonuclease III [Erysipelotrichaceae bacterium]